tara:strand:- start:329 stop:757 length:429 start_codon:yes stop_codon:yes gene_type:complete
MKLLMALLCGMLFGFGLALSGMTDINNVIGFLDLFGDWNPMLAFVMVGGILVSLPFFQFGLGKIKAPLFADVFRLPTKTDIDGRLIGGAALFGIGWGLVGLCPGPAIASLAYLNIDILYFGVAMMAGLFVTDFVDRLLTAKS